MRQMEKSQLCKLTVCSFKPDQQTIFYTIHMSSIESISDQLQFKSKSMCWWITYVKLSLILQIPFWSLNQNVFSVAVTIKNMWGGGQKGSVMKVSPPSHLSGHCDRGREWKHARVKAATYLWICWRGFIHLSLDEGIDFVILFCFSKPVDTSCDISLCFFNVEVIFSPPVSLYFQIIVHFYIYSVQPLSRWCPPCCVTEFEKKKKRRSE